MTDFRNLARDQEVDRFACGCVVIVSAETVSLSRRPAAPIRPCGRHRLDLDRMGSHDFWRYLQRTEGLLS
jgi:hypothetical protein